MDKLEAFMRALPNGPFWPTGAFFKKLLTLLIQDRVRAGTNLTEHPTEKGRFFMAEAGGSGASVPPAPFDLTLDLSTNSPKAQLRPGKVNELVATNVLETYDVPSGVLSFVYGKIYSDGKAVTNWEIKTGPTEPTVVYPVKNAAPPLVYVLLYLIDYQAPGPGEAHGTYTPYRVFPRGNVRALLREAFRTSATGGSPGRLTYDPWYGWTITSDVTQPDD